MTKTLFLAIVVVDDEKPRAALNRQSITNYLASLLGTGVLEGVEVSVQTIHPSKDPTTVHVHDGKVRIEREPHQPSTEESRDQSAPKAASRRSHKAGDRGVADC